MHKYSPTSSTPRASASTVATPELARFAATHPGARASASDPNSRTVAALSPTPAVSPPPVVSPTTDVWPTELSPTSGVPPTELSPTGTSSTTPMPEPAPTPATMAAASKREPVPQQGSRRASPGRIVARLAIRNAISGGRAVQPVDGPGPGGRGARAVWCVRSGGGGQIWNSNVDKNKLIKFI